MLVERFGLDVERIEKALMKYDCKILKEKLKYNIECLKQKKKGTTKYLNYDSFARFHFDVSEVISKELINYASKSSKLHVRFRQSEK